MYCTSVRNKPRLIFIPDDRGRGEETGPGSIDIKFKFPCRLSRAFRLEGTPMSPSQ